tara:strand:+ start:349 stop:585 length:237 start_codon:yes stop_codon:yes gene_type:complete
MSEEVKRSVGRPPIHEGEAWHVKILLGEAIHQEIEQIAEVAGTPMTDQYRIAIGLGLEQMRKRREVAERRRAKRRKLS